VTLCLTVLEELYLQLYRYDDFTSGNAFKCTLTALSAVCKDIIFGRYSSFGFLITFHKVSSCLKTIHIQVTFTFVRIIMHSISLLIRAVRPT